jgi:2-octaprenyl-6-methoxyphenol hydroxylase
MSSAPSADVIIAGAGITGATLALALASAGVKAILVDPLPFETQTAPSFDGRASAIAYSSFRQWLQIGVGERLEPLAQRIEQILVTDGRSPGASAGKVPSFFLRFDAAEIADRSEGEPLGYMLENQHIRAGLAEALTQAGVEVLAPARVASVLVEAAGASVTLDDGRVLTAPLVVGAEGKASTVRQAA